ncbi:MAG: hypothetical protein ACTHOH_13000 [Lysobacteraceae bacterium]
MRILKPAAVYFLQVFGTGFALAFVRIPVLVPRFGVRTAELMEMPVMLTVIVWSSRRLAYRHPDWSRGRRLAAGLGAFCLLVGAELGVAWLFDGHSPGAYIATRDPVSGSAYLASLVCFAVAPALWRAGTTTTIAPIVLKLQADEAHILQKIRAALAPCPDAEIVYRSEWLGYLPFGVYHWVEAPRGTDISRDFPTGWTLGHIESLESAGHLRRVSFRQDPEDEHDIEIVFVAGGGDGSGPSHPTA